MGSYQFDGVTFRAYPGDHEPPHVHGMYQGIAVILELGEDGRVRLARRKDVVRPSNADINKVKHVSHAANKCFDDLMRKWEEAHA